MLAREDGPVGEHLSQNAAHRPDVDGLGVALGRRGKQWAPGPASTGPCCLGEATAPSRLKTSRKEEGRGLEDLMRGLLPEPNSWSLVTRPGSWGSCLVQRWLQGFLGPGPFPSGVGGPPTLELSMISGARYQRVATYSVRKPVWSCSGSAIRARPKSQIWKPTQAAKVAAQGPSPKAQAVLSPRLSPRCSLCS